MSPTVTVVTTSPWGAARGADPRTPRANSKRWRRYFRSPCCPVTGNGQRDVDRTCGGLTRLTNQRITNGAQLAS
jgi:hypothetical protein